MARSRPSVEQNHISAICARQFNTSVRRHYASQAKHCELQHMPGRSITRRRLQVSEGGGLKCSPMQISSLQLPTMQDSRRPLHTVSLGPDVFAGRQSVWRGCPAGCSVTDGSRNGASETKL